MEDTLSVERERTTAASDVESEEESSNRNKLAIAVVLIVAIAAGAVLVPSAMGAAWLPAFAYGAGFGAVTMIGIAVAARIR